MISRSLLFVILSTTLALAQEATPPRSSPLSLVTARYKDTYLKITYSQPSKRGRIIFGDLVPYNQVWRTGANEATEITITKDIKLDNQLLKAGTYSIFTIPKKDFWTVIINKDLGLWGSYNYNASMDVFRLEVPVQVLQDGVYEAFTIQVDQRNNKAELVFLWDIIRVAVPIQFNEPVQ